MSEYKNNFIKRKIVSFLFIAVLATIFCGCKKDFTDVEEVRIVSTSISEITSTSAVFTIVLEGNGWWLDGTGLGLSHYNSNINIAWYEDYEDYEDIDGIYRNRKKYIAYIEGLDSGCHYWIYAYIEKDDIFIWSEALGFTTEM